MSQRSDEEEESFLDWEREKRRQKDIRKRLEETEWVSSEEESDDGDKADSGSDGSGCAGESNGKDNGNQKSDEDDESSSSEEETETAEEKKVREEEQKRKQEEELEKKRKEEEGIHFLLRKYFPESLQKEKAAKERDNETDSDKNPKRTSWGGTDAQRDPKAPLPTAAQSLSSSGLLRTSQPNMESKATSTPTSTQGHRRSHSTSQTHAAAPGTAGAIPRLTLSGMDNIAGDAGVEAAGATVTKKAMSPRGDASPGSVASRSNNRRSVILGGKDKQKETKKKEKEKARTPHKEVKREVSAVFCYSDRMMMMDREEAERRRQQELRLLQMREEEKRKQQQAATVQSTSPVRPSSMEVKLVHGTTGDPAPASKHASGNSAAVHSAPDAGPQVNKNMQRWELLLHIPQESLMKARQERLRLDLQKNTKAQKHLQRLSPRALEKTISELLLLDPEAGEKLLAERIRQEKERKLKLREDDKKRRSRNERAGN